MNAKLCKLLRRTARLATAELPERAYETKAIGKTVMVPRTGRSPISFKFPDQVVLASGCTQAAYKQLKKHVRSTQ